MRTLCLLTLLTSCLAIDAHADYGVPPFPLAPVNLSSQDIIVRVGGTVSITVTSLGPAVIPFHIYSENPQVAAADTTLGNSEMQTSLVITGKSLGQTLIEYTVPSFGHGLVSGIIGRVTVVPCPVPVVVSHPTDQSVLAGTRATLFIAAGGQESYAVQWFARAASESAFHLLEERSGTLTTAPLNETTHFLVNVSNSCGVGVSYEFTMTVSTPRGRSARH